VRIRIFRSPRFLVQEQFLRPREGFKALIRHQKCHMIVKAYKMHTILPFYTRYIKICCFCCKNPWLLLLRMCIFSLRLHYIMTNSALTAGSLRPVNVPTNKPRDGLRASPDPCFPTTLSFSDCCLHNKLRDEPACPGQAKP
jgi:hypothetical protein